MTLKTLSLGMSLGLFIITMLAGCNQEHGHSHSPAPVDQETAKSSAETIVADLVSKSKLDKSWASISASSVVKSGTSMKTEWEVVLVNEGVEDTSKQKLYVFLNSSGEYIAENFTGR